MVNNISFIRRNQSQLFPDSQYELEEHMTVLQLNGKRLC